VAVKPPKLLLIADHDYFAKYGLVQDEKWLMALKELGVVVCMGDLGPWSRAFAAAGQMLKPGDVAIQIRIKKPASSRRQRLCCGAMEILAPKIAQGLRVSLGGELGEAREHGFSGTHLPERELRRAAKESESKSLNDLSAAIHDADGLDAAERAGVDYAVFGPVYSPSCKAREGVGLAALRRLADAARVPVVAVGGITTKNMGGVLAAGAVGVATLSGAWSLVFQAAEVSPIGREYVC